MGGRREGSVSRRRTLGAVDRGTDEKHSADTRTPSRILPCLNRPTQPMYGSQTSTHRVPSELSRWGDTNDTMPSKVPDPTLSTSRGSKRKLEPDFLQAAKDMDFLVKDSAVEQTRPLARGLFAWITGTDHLRD